MLKSKSILGIMLVICALVTCHSSLVTISFAQSATATLSGTAVDQSGAAVPGVEVTIISYGTGLLRKTVSGGEGTFVFPLLPPGQYKVTAERNGFTPVEIKNVILNVGDQVSLRILLKVGQVSTAINVTEEASLINESPSVGTVIDRKFVENLPLNGQSFNTLLQLTPGVVIVPSSPSSPGQFSVNGQRADANSFQVDGVSANFGVSGSSLTQGGGGTAPAFNSYGGTASLVSVDALQEFRVETSSYAPEFGRTPGGQVSIITRSGTNQFHGTLFDFFRNDVLDANNWFVNAAGKPRAAERQNDFGGTFSGPVLLPRFGEGGRQPGYNGHDRTFFFFSYEGLRLKQPQAAVIQVPSLALRRSPTTVPAAAAVLNAYPLPDPSGPISADGNTAQFTGNYSNQISMDAASLRVDQALNSRLTLFGRYNHSPSETNGRRVGFTWLEKTLVDTTTFTLGVDGQISQNVTNAFRFNYSRQKVTVSDELDSLGGAIPPNYASFLPAPYSTANSFIVFTSLANNRVPSLFFGTSARNNESQWNLVDDLSFSKGAHRLKFGSDYRRLLLNSSGVSFNPIFVARDATMFASTGTVPQLINPVTKPATILFNAFSLYAQDIWHVGQRLTLTYGVRWEFNPTPPSVKTPLASWQNVHDPANLVLAPVGTPIWQTSYGNFAPRVGVAYQPTSKADFVIRSGFGVFYDLGTGIAPLLAKSFPLSATFSQTVGTFPVPLVDTNSVTPTFSSSPPYTGVISGFDPNLKLPYSYQWNVAVEKSFHGAQALSATYLGQVGRRLLRNEKDVKPNARFQGDFALTTNGDSSNYKALQLQYKKRLEKRLQVLLNYSWSHSIDTNSDDSILNVSTLVFAPAGERGSSSFDVRHNFTGAFTYSVPGLASAGILKQISEGWSLSAFVLARSGFPINVNTNSVGVGTFSASSRPDLVPGQPIWLANGSAPGRRVLNPLAFALPATPRQGTLPRNSIYGFGATQVDTSVQRNFNITERLKLHFRADIFNLLNHPNFANPFSIFNKPLSSQFGFATQMLNSGLTSGGGAGLNSLYNIGGPRSIQLSLKLAF